MMYVGDHSIFSTFHLPSLTIDSSSFAPIIGRRWNAQEKQCIQIPYC